MKNLFCFLIFSSVSTMAMASNPAIHCRGVNDSLYEVIVKEGKALSASQIKSLSPSMKRKISGAESVSTYKMTIFRGEAVPQNVEAIGATADVLLQVFSLTGPEKMSTYLDELGPNDISSSLTVDGRTIDMSCQ